MKTLSPQEFIILLLISVFTCLKLLSSFGSSIETFLFLYALLHLLDFLMNFYRENRRIAGIANFDE